MPRKSESILDAQAESRVPQRGAPRIDPDDGKLDPRDPRVAGNRAADDDQRDREERVAGRHHEEVGATDLTSEEVIAENELEFFERGDGPGA